MAEQQGPLSYPDQILEHLAAMARVPGAQAYAWHAAKHYEQLDPQDLGGIQERLRQRMEKEKEQQ